MMVDYRHMKKIHTYINKKRNEGFTILETMVAVFILVLSITGPMVFAQTGLRSAFLARDQITAFYLAQDIIETIKNIRDENGLNSVNWLTNIDACDTGDTCVIHIDTVIADPVAQVCTGGVCPPLEIDANKRYSYDGNEPSRFTRTTYIRETTNEVEAQIVVIVEWQSNVRVGRSRIMVQENIYNWIPTVQ